MLYIGNRQVDLLNNSLSGLPNIDIINSKKQILFGIWLKKKLQLKIFFSLVILGLTPILLFNLKSMVDISESNFDLYIKVVSVLLRLCVITPLIPILYLFLVLLKSQFQAKALVEDLDYEGVDLTSLNKEFAIFLVVQKGIKKKK